MGSEGLLILGLGLCLDAFWHIPVKPYDFVNFVIVCSIVNELCLLYIIIVLSIVIGLTARKRC